MTCFKYYYEYGLANYIENMHGSMLNIRMGNSKEKNKNNQEAINERNKAHQVSMKSRGDYHKKGYCLARTFVSPCFGREPKARVATNIIYEGLIGLSCFLLDLSLPSTS
jgi:hypothetical protein